MRAKRIAHTPRFWLQAPLQANTPLTLDKRSSHHLCTVLRARKGATVVLFNGDGHDYHAEVLETGERTPGKRARLQLHQRQYVNHESPLAVTLVQGIARGDRMDSCIRQAVELGVHRIQPLQSRHAATPTDATRAAKRQAHWQSIVISACEQSGRAQLPELAEPLQLGRWLEQHTDSVNLRLILSPGAVLTLEDLPNSPPASATILIGPESGFDVDEVQVATTAGILPVAFGPRVLRTETAGPAMLAVLQARFGDLGSA